MGVKINGVEIVDLDDLIETVQLAAADSVEGAQAFEDYVKRVERNSTAGGIILDIGTVFILKMLASCVVDNATAAHKAATDVALARLEGVR